MALGVVRENLIEKAGITESVFNAYSNSIPPEILYALVKKESNFDKYAVRYEAHYKWLCKPEEFAKRNRTSVATEKAFQKFSYGPLQIMGANIRALKYEGPFPLIISKPSNLFSLGAAFLHSLYQRYGNWPDAVSAYNQGAPRKSRLTGKYKNQEYVDDVMQFAKLAGYECQTSV